MRNVRKLWSIILVVLFLTACSSIQIEGIEYYEKNTCSVGLTANLFPSDDFLSKFDYVQSNYHYLDTEDWVWGYAKAFACLSYDPKVYAEAKEYCMDACVLSGGHSFLYGQYGFSEYLCYESKDDTGNWILESDFPRHFNMFGFHDQSHTLFFLGYYNGDPKSHERTLAEEDFGVFLKTVYGEYYNWDESEK